MRGRVGCVRGEWGVRGREWDLMWRVGVQVREWDVRGGVGRVRESEGEGGVCEGESVSGVSGGGGESWGVKGRVGCKGESGKELDVRV